MTTLAFIRRISLRQGLAGRLAGMLGLAGHVPKPDEYGPLASFRLADFARCLPLFLLLLILASRYTPKLWCAFFVLTGTAYALTYLVLAIARRLLGPMPKVDVLAVAVLVSMASGGAAALMVFREVRSDLPRYIVLPWQVYLMILAMTALLILPDIWRDGHLAAERREQAAREEKVRLEKALLEAELRTLQAQVEPHFLYNTLANVQYLTRHDPQTAGLMVSRLIGYLRLALPELRGPASTVSRELSMAQHYLEIMALRMGGRLRFLSHCDKTLHTRPMPPLMLISLVENAVRHGIEPKPGDGEIVVSITPRGGWLHLEVLDDGVGLRAGQLGGGVGLRNIQQRLQALYGGRASFELRSRPEGGVIASLSWPDEGDSA